MTMQASSVDGKLLVWPHAGWWPHYFYRLMGACGCCAKPPPECVHLRVMDMEGALICEADLHLTGTPRNPDAIEWNCWIPGSYDEPEQAHYIAWTCHGGTNGHFVFGIDYTINPQGSHFQTNFGYGIDGTFSYCDGPPTGLYSGFNHQFQASACAVPGVGRPKRACSECRGL